MTRRPIKRVEGHAAIDPACRVPCVEGIRQRWQEIFVDPRSIAYQSELLSPDTVRKLKGRQSADQRFGEFPISQSFEIGPDLIEKTQPDLVGHDLLIENPGPGFWYGHGLRQEIVHLQDLDSAIPHFRHEVEMIALGVFHPQDIVKEKRVTIAWCQPLVRSPGGADHDLAQLPNFGMNAKRCRLCHDLRLSV
ncbi:hypothetical protein D3C72_1743710 [compost metagenome]